MLNHKLQSFGKKHLGQVLS